MEYTEVTTAEWGGITGIPVLLLMGFALAQLAFYVLAAFVIKLAGATSYNISILTADFYSLIVGIYLFQYKVSIYIHSKFREGESSIRN